MTKKEKIAVSFVVATFVAIVDIFHRKFGGHLSGGRFSNPHTWSELKEYIPEFLWFFVASFVGLTIYQLIGKEEDLICPKCEEGFKGIPNAKCPKCGAIGEKSEGFYKRHPELMNK